MSSPHAFGGLDADTAALIFSWLSPLELVPLRRVSRSVALAVNSVANGLRTRWERRGLVWPADTGNGTGLALLLLAYLSHCSFLLRDGDSDSGVLPIARVPVRLELAKSPPMTVDLPAVDVLVPLRIWRPDLLGILSPGQAILVQEGDRRRLVPTPPVALLRVVPLPPEEAAGASQAPEAGCAQLQPSHPTALYSAACNHYAHAAPEEAGSSGDAESARVARHGLVRRGSGQSSLYVITEAQARACLERTFRGAVFERVWGDMPYGGAEAGAGGALWLVLNWAESELDQNLPLACFHDQLTLLARLHPLPGAAVATPIPAT
mmetsp:Transcript_6615/g.22647  ORF Transcript_6615/g.22647 Transcript_6615/m.22647 type:complete len:321 (+) Transcript_6615:21-983(+)